MRKLLLSALLVLSLVGQSFALDTGSKLLLHGDGTDLGTTITDEIGKTVTNTATYDTYTKVMYHFEDAENDSTSNHNDFTAQGTAALSTAQKKFGAKSLLLDGNSDYLTVPDSADWDFGAGAFTFDCWVRPNSSEPSNYCIFSQDAGGANNQFYSLVIFKSIVQFSNYEGEYPTGAYVVRFTCPATWVADTWYHIAVVRIDNGNASTSWRIFINGVSKNLTLLSGAWNGSITAITGPLRIGCTRNAGFFGGYIDELRISKGIARWTANFTPPVAPYGQVTIDTGVKKFGTGSLLFDGSGSYLSLADSADWDFGSGNFTIDGQFRYGSVADTNVWVTQWNAGDTDRSFRLRGGSTGDFNLYFEWTTDGTSGTNVSKSVAWTPVIDTWYHVAVVRNGNDLKFYVNGTQQGATQDITGVTIFNSNQVLTIGRNGDTNQYYFNGYIDELRISKGVARWTGAFTTPARAYGDRRRNILTL